MKTDRLQNRNQVQKATWLEMILVLGSKTLLYEHHLLTFQRYILRARDFILVCDRFSL